MEKLVFATNNLNKVKEIKLLLPSDIQILSLHDIGWDKEIEEVGSSFSENAQIKAESVFKRMALPCIAEDSGLEVDALQGAPGVHSARYTQNGKSQDNIQKLLSALQNISERTARLVCVMCLKTETGVLFFKGALPGHIAMQPQGTQGFGYDPIFIPQSYKNTLAQLSTEEKNQISHRAKALKKWRRFIKNHKNS